MTDVSSICASVILQVKKTLSKCHHHQPPKKLFLYIKELLSFRRAHSWFTSMRLSHILKNNHTPKHYQCFICDMVKHLEEGGVGGGMEGGGGDWSGCNIKG